MKRQIRYFHVWRLTFDEAQRMLIEIYFRLQNIKTRGMATILNIQNLGKTYQSAGRELTVLENISFTVEAGSTMAIVGPSGSGKTTLLGLAAGLDRSSTGTVE